MMCEIYNVRDKVFEGADAASSAPTPAPFYFGPASRRLFGWYHAPRAGAERHVGVVLCRPLHHEAVFTYAFYRHLAEELAHAGYAVLRFDYDGTGNSFGDDMEPGRVQAWRESIHFAIETLQGASQTSETVLFGMRLGATLAASVASERDDVSGLVFWGACPTGRNYLREMRALRASSAQPSGEGEAAAAEYEETAGFVVTTETATDLSALDATKLSQRLAPRALLIDRDDLPGEKKLGKRLTELGTTVTTAEGLGYAALMRDTKESEMPETAAAEIIDWLNRERTTTPRAARLTPSRSLLPQRARLEAEGYFEEPVLHNGSFGILTHPCQRTPRSKTTVVLLSVGANPHIGPGRMYVTLARALATQGFSVFRLDVTGVGDSVQGSATGRDSIYSETARDDVPATLDDLSQRLQSEKFVLVGLCSGAYIAYQVAAKDARVSAQVLLNVQALEWHEGDSVEVHIVRSMQNYKPTNVYFSTLPNGGTVKRLLLGQIDVKGIAGALRKRFVARARLHAKNLGSLVRHGRLYETSVCRTLRQTAERGTRTLFVLAEGDHGVEITTAHIGNNGRKIRAAHRPTIEIIAEGDHTFTLKAARDQMLFQVVRHLCDFFPTTRA